jgi:hypothetical protein
MGSDDASFVQGEKPPTSEDPESTVIRVARKSSGTFAPAPRERLERVALSLFEHTLQAYRDASSARAAGDELGADALRDCGNHGQDMLVSALDVLAGLQS